MDARLIIDPPATGTWNMAADEALFQTAQHNRQTTLRFYQWSEPTLSLGYFQRAIDRQRHPASHRCSLVRRSTGGGAIVHDRELTYSLVIPIQDDRSLVAQSLVELVHEALIAVLQEFGITATRHKDRSAHQPSWVAGAKCTHDAPESSELGHREYTLPQPPMPKSDTRATRDSEPFLCFQRRNPDDVVIREDKVAGSAQRRLYGTLLQHGSVLLGRSPAAPELPGIADITGRNISLDQLRDRWIDLLGRKLSWTIALASRTQEESRLTGEFERSKFATNEWNLKR